MAKPLENRIALITGASRGIGQAVAVRMAKEGAHVILVARSKSGLEETDDAVRAAGGQATLVQLDLSDFPKIDELAQMIGERFKKLDILIGNAALLGELAPMAHQSPVEWHKTVDVNLHTNFHLIRCFDVWLKASDAPRAMFVSSGIARGAHPYWGAYAVSKAALESLVITYAAENTKTALKANLISPGQVRTRMHAQAFPGIDPETITPTEAVTDIFVTLAHPDLKDTGKLFYAQD